MKGLKYTVHMIGNAHIDPVWLWKWQEGSQTIRATFKSAIERLNEYPEFVFTASSAFFYNWLEEIDKELFDEIRQKVKEKRWCLVGGWWVEPDCNIPGGEALVRQGLYGQRYFYEKFGVRAKVGFNPDSFGHNMMLPQILKKMGIDYYVFMRPGPHEKKLPGNLFWWQSSDGSGVLAYRISLSYAGPPGDLKEHIQKSSEAFNPEELKSSPGEIMCFYGVGDHGGGPTRENIESIKALTQQFPDNSPRTLFSSPDGYFEEISDKSPSLPVVRDELQHHASGCYSVLSWIKKSNRKLENLLLTAEKFSLMANYFNKNRTYPQAKLTRAWQMLLFTQFHDILGGVSIPEVYDEVRAVHGEVENISSQVINGAIQSIAGKIDTDGEGKALLIFNSTSFDREVPLEVEYQWSTDKISVIDKDGTPVPSQALRISSTIPPGWRKGICFIAKVPAFGYTTYRLISESINIPQSRMLSATSHSLENDWLRVEIDSGTGYLKRIYDKRNHREVLKGPGAIPVVIKDLSDTWSHNVFRFKDEMGRFSRATVKVLEEGSIRGKVRIKSNFHNSTLIQDVTLYRDLDIIEVKVVIDWHEKQRMLKFSFPVNVASPRATYQIPYGFIQRPCNGEEEPGLSWVDVSDDDYGLSLVNNAKYSYDVENSDLRLTVLRSPLYAHHIPKVLERGVDYQCIDQGEQTFTYILVPHKGNWQKAFPVKWAENLNNPPVVLVEHCHKGELSKEQSFIEVYEENVIVTALKKAEDTDDIVLRLYETRGESTETDIALFERSWKVRLNPCEIKTFLIPRDKKSSVMEVNLLEF